MNRWDIINHFIKKNGYKNYLEIGVFHSWNWNNIQCERKTAVDPDVNIPVPQGGEFFNVTSDAFFESLPAEVSYDIIFIDGLHEAAQVTRDIDNSLARLSPGGTIVVHDCNPPTLAHATTGDAAGNWNGNVYEAIIDAGINTQIDLYVIDTDWGVGIVKPNPDPPLRDPYHVAALSHWQKKPDWETFDVWRKDLLNLISVEEFLKREAIHETV